MAPLTGLIIAAAGDFGRGKGVEQLSKWVVRNGGRWASRIAKGITHLICSKEAYKKNVDAVKQAKGLGVYIVSYDWLEDSLQARRRLAEKRYTWVVQREKRRKTKKIKRLGHMVDTDKFLKGCELAQEDLGSGTSRTSSSRSGGFFASALEDLRQRREAREAEEKAKRAAAMERKLASRKDDGAAASDSPSVPALSAVQPQLIGRLQNSIHPAQSTSPPTPQTPVKSSTAPPAITDPLPSPPSARSPHTLPTPSASPSSIPSPPAHQESPTERKLSDLYHIYLDHTGFEYNLKLLRADPTTRTATRYDLRLYESHTIPHVYCTFACYTPPTAPPAARNPPSPAAHDEAARLRALIAPLPPSPSTPSTRLLAPLNSPFAPAFRAFRHAFRDLTLLSWAERLGVRGAPAAELQRLRRGAFGAAAPFAWKRPDVGLPVGLFSGERRAGGEEKEAGYVWNEWGLAGVEREERRGSEADGAWARGLGAKGHVESALEKRVRCSKGRVEGRERAAAARGKGRVKAKAKEKEKAKAPAFTTPDEVRAYLDKRRGEAAAAAATTGGESGDDGWGSDEGEGLAKRSGKAIFINHMPASRAKPCGRYDY